MQTEAQKRAKEKYDATNTKGIYLKLNKRTDADILDRLDEMSNAQGYIKSLIRQDIARSTGNMYRVDLGHYTANGFHEMQTIEYMNEEITARDYYENCLANGVDLAEHLEIDGEGISIEIYNNKTEEMLSDFMVELNENGERITFG